MVLINFIEKGIFFPSVAVRKKTKSEIIDQKI